LVATSLNYLRVFTHGGVQRGIICIPGAPVCVVGEGDWAAVVYNGMRGREKGEGERGREKEGKRGREARGRRLLIFLHFLAFPGLALLLVNLQDGTTRYESGLPLSPGATLTWLGFAGEVSFPLSLPPSASIFSLSLPSSLPKKKNRVPRFQFNVKLNSFCGNWSLLA
jgi:hypothetical protein